MPEQIKVQTDIMRRTAKEVAFAIFDFFMFNSLLITPPSPL
jgi:hypothetical protein